MDLLNITQRHNPEDLDFKLR